MKTEECDPHYRKRKKVNERECSPKSSLELGFLRFGDSDLNGFSILKCCVCVRERGQWESEREKGQTEGVIFRRGKWGWGWAQCIRRLVWYNCPENLDVYPRPSYIVILRTSHWWSASKLFICPWMFDLHSQNHFYFDWALDSTHIVENFYTTWSLALGINLFTILINICGYFFLYF